MKPHPARALLISMPFGTTTQPSIGLGLMKGALLRDGLPCDVRYLNLDFAARIGVGDYTRVANTIPGYAIGDWIFAPELFGERTPPTSQFLEMWRAAGRPAFPDDEPRLFAIREETAPFLDECMAKVPWDDYALVGFTTLFQQTVASLALARRLKDRFPRLQIVFGGANCEGEMGAALHRLFPFIDYVCAGEADVSFPRLARAILSGEPAHDIAGVFRRIDGQSVAPSEKLTPVTDLDSLPFPNYDDYLEERERSGIRGDRNVAFPIETSRGCWWGQKAHCTFCGLNGETMQFRAKSPDRAIAELNMLRDRYQARFITAVDNILSVRYFREVLPHLAGMSIELELFYEIKANLRRDQVRLLRESGIAHIQPGIESFSSRVLTLMRKGVSALQNIQLLKWCSEYMVHPTWNLLAGFPGEEPADYARQAELVPLITHLPPPVHGRVTPVRLDRFSPLFTQAESFGVRDIRPAEGYLCVYPFPMEDVAALAYYFRFRYADGRRVASYTKDLDREIGRWRHEKGSSMLLSVDHGDRLMIYDTRPVAVRHEHELRDRRRAVHEYCDVARTRAEIEAMCSRLPPEQQEADVEAILDALVADRLMISEDGRFLSLAVPVEYQIQTIASRTAAGRPLPVAMRAALGRLMDPRIPGVTAALAEKMINLSQPAAGLGGSEDLPSNSPRVTGARSLPVVRSPV
jgi:ribosomal peptide maturation radical SAM protein 1